MATKQQDFKNIRQTLLLRRPMQWITQFSILATEGNGILKAGDFDDAFKFALTPMSKDGLGMSKKQLYDLITYNPDYAHLASELLDMESMKSIAKEVTAIGKVGRPIKGSDSKNTTLIGRGQSYKISKLKRDYGDSEVMAAIEVTAR